MTLLHAHAQYIYIVNAKYQKPSVKALVEANVHAHVDVYLFKSFVKMRKYLSAAIPLDVIIFLHMLDNICNTAVSVKSGCLI